MDPTKVKPGSANFIKKLLVKEKKILFSLLHLKLRLMKQYVRALNKTGDYFKYIAKKMPKLSDSKLEAGIFDGPQIRTLFNDKNFILHLTDVEKAAWTSFRKVCQNFLGNKKYKLGDYSEEQGERCYQDMKDFEKRYQGVWDVNMMADYC